MAVRLRLREILDERDMTQVRLRQLTGLGYSSISLLCNNKTERVEFETLDALCKALKVQPGELLEYVPDRTARRSGKERR